MGPRQSVQKYSSAGIATSPARRRNRRSPSLRVRILALPGLYVSTTNVSLMLWGCPGPKGVVGRGISASEHQRFSSTITCSPPSRSSISSGSVSMQFNSSSVVCNPPCIKRNSTRIGPAPGPQSAGERDLRFGPPAR